jgi:hypothetical protein
VPNNGYIGGMTNRIAIGAHAEVYYKDEEYGGKGFYAYFSFGEEVADEKGDIVGDTFGVADIYIFFYASGEDEIKGFMNSYMSVSHEDFVVTEYSIAYKEIEND